MHVKLTALTKKRGGGGGGEKNFKKKKKKNKNHKKRGGGGGGGGMENLSMKSLKHTYTSKSQIGQWPPNASILPITIVLLFAHTNSHVSLLRYGTLLLKWDRMNACINKYKYNKYYTHTTHKIIIPVNSEH